MHGSPPQIFGSETILEFISYHPRYNTSHYIKIWSGSLNSEQWSPQPCPLLIVDAGFYTSVHQRFRLKGIDTPEIFAGEKNQQITNIFK
jgi:hypothetical protein